MMSIQWRILFFLFFLGLVGCSLPPELIEGDQAFKKGDFDGAVAKYTLATQNHPDRPEYRTKLQQAKEKAAVNHFQKGQDLRKKEFDLRGALGEFDLALKFKTDSLETQKARSEIQAYLNMLKEKIRQATGANKRKDWFRCEKLLYYHRRYSKAFPEIKQLWEKAATESFAIYMGEGMRYYYLTQYDKALKQFREAVRLRPKNKVALKRLESCKKKRESQNLFYQTISAMKKEDYSSAQNMIQRALKLDPTNPRALALLSEATRKRAVVLVGKAEKHRSSGELVPAYRALKEAQSLKPSGEILQKKISDRLGDTKKRMAARWYRIANQLEQKGLYGAAWIRFKQAELIWPGFSNAKERLGSIEKRIPQALNYRLSVLPVGGNATRIRAGALKKITLQCTAELQKKLPSKFFGVYPYGQILEGSVQGLHLSGVLRIRLDQFEILLTAKRVEQDKKYIALVGRQVNQNKFKLWKNMTQARKNMENLSSQAREVQGELQRKKRAFEEAKGVLEKYKKEHPPTKSLTPQEEGSDPRTIRIKELQTKIDTRKLEWETFQTSRVDVVERQLSQSKTRYESLRKTYLAEKIFLEKKYPKTYRYTRLTITKTGTVRVKLTLIDFISNKKWLDETFNYTESKTDTTQKGFSPAGVDEDGLKLPDNKKITANLIRGVLQKALPKIQHILQSAQNRFVLAMSQAGKTPSLHYALLAYRSRQDPAYRSKNKLKKDLDGSLVKKILNLTGYNIIKNKLIDSKLTF